MNRAELVFDKIALSTGKYVRAIANRYRSHAPMMGQAMDTLIARTPKKLLNKQIKGKDLKLQLEAIKGIQEIAPNIKRVKSSGGAILKSFDREIGSSALMHAANTTPKEILKAEKQRKKFIKNIKIKDLNKKLDKGSLLDFLDQI